MRETASTRATTSPGCCCLPACPPACLPASGVNKIYCLTQFNSASLNRHLSQAYVSSLPARLMLSATMQPPCTRPLLHLPCRTLNPAAGLPALTRKI
jgi:hypothetical protein